MGDPKDLAVARARNYGPEPIITTPAAVPGKTTGVGIVASCAAHLTCRGESRED